MFKSLIPWRRENEQRRENESFGSLADRDMASFQNRLDDMINRVWGEESKLFDLFGSSEGGDLGWGCDVKDSDKEIVIRAEAPGFEPDEIDVRMSGDQLVMEAEHREDRQGNGNGYRYGKLYRSMTLPRGINPDEINAEYKNGVLEVRCPKGPEANARRVAVKSS